MIDYSVIIENTYSEITIEMCDNSVGERESQVTEGL